ncbi:hypothetical protein [Polluticaenibacter yanchengensis]|uniref:Uncharacterized protein n=1 Tax=Polluticaenibacter yanchengensis TaxID=3014562 RepID=A0ABT4UFQ4_9BACT|nr:hypothetical protein [Chitinophagaceae bacterium LY-5]
MSQSSFYYVRSEALITTFIQLGYSVDNMDIDFNGDFRKKFTGSLESFEIDESEIRLQLNDNSIYDNLPEGLFHQSKGNQHNQSYKNYIDEHNRFKNEAKNARRFFNPLDQAFLFAKSDALLRKEMVLQDLMADETAFLLKFWGLEHYKDNVYISAFVKQLYKRENVQSRIDEIALLTGTILQCKVKTETDFVQWTKETITEEDWLLGFNTCLEAENSETILQWTFIIENTNPANIESYFMKRDVYEILQLINRFFVPVDVITTYEFELPELKQLDEAYIGISTL